MITCLHENVEVEEDLVDGVDERLVHEGLAVVVDLSHLGNNIFFLTLIP